MKEKKRILNIVIIIMSMILVVSFLSTIYKIKDESDDVYSESDFSSSLSWGEGYHELVKMYHYNQSNEVKETEGLKEYYGVARYFEAASYYKIYQTAGEMEKAEQCYAEMQEAEKSMGELVSLKEEIDKELKLEEE